MHTLYEIAQHVVTRKPYNTQPSQYEAPIGWQESRAYKLLTEQTTPDIVKRVRDFATGKLPLTEIETEITDESAYRYLAAAKVVDLDTAPADLLQSTYEIRKLALLISRPKEEGLGEINMMNAFSTPPLDKENIDVLLANELSNTHPTVKKAKFGEEKDSYLKRIFTYGKTEANIIPEMVAVIEGIMKDRFQAMMNIENFLPTQTTVIFKGPSGTGKSIAAKDFIEQHVKGITVDQAVQSTDNVKNDIRARTRKIFSDEHAHLFGFCAYSIFVETLKKTQPNLSTLQEGWFNGKGAIEKLFTDLKNGGLKLDMHDFDGDYETLCLRVLVRYDDPNSPTPPLDQVERGFKTSRESRKLLLDSLRPKEDAYECTFINSHGQTIKGVQAASAAIIESNPVFLDGGMAAIRKMVVSEKHVERFGESLQKYLGMTIEAAFDKAKGI